MTEPKVVVAHREHLWWLLAEAAQLEHMIMCQYLYAEFSLKDGSGDGLAAGQAEAVERWIGPPPAAIQLVRVSSRLAWLVELPSSSARPAPRSSSGAPISQAEPSTAGSPRHRDHSPPDTALYPPVWTLAAAAD